MPARNNCTGCLSFPAVQAAACGKLWRLNLARHKFVVATNAPWQSVAWNQTGLGQRQHTHSEAYGTVLVVQPSAGSELRKLLPPSWPPRCEVPAASLASSFCAPGRMMTARHAHWQREKENPWKACVITEVLKVKEKRLRDSWGLHDSLNLRLKGYPTKRPETTSCGLNPRVRDILRKSLRQQQVVA
jgi:hypothetical protein